MDPRYAQTFSGKGSDEEMTELVRRVQEDRHVLLWSKLLKDLVVFHRDDFDTAALPHDFIPYSDTEIKTLCENDLSERSIKRVHSIKKHGADAGKRNGFIVNGVKDQEETQGAMDFL